MKKYIILFSVLTFMVVKGYSQCSKTYASTGVYPTQLADAYELVTFNQEIDFTLPADTSYMSQSIHIDSVKVNSVSGFPGSNFSYSCGVVSCMYVPNANNKFQGCFTITGIAPAGSAGNYKMHVQLDGYIQTPFGQQIYTIEDSSVNFTVKGCNVTTTISTADAKLCYGESTKLNATGTGKFLWWNDATKLADTAASVTVTNGGVYQAILIDSATGCTDSSNILQIDVMAQLAKPTISLAGAGKVVGNIKGKNYKWKYNGSINTSYDGKDTVTGPSGYYQYSYQDTNGCWSPYSDSTSNSGIWSLKNSYQVSLQPNPSNGLFSLMIQNNNHERFKIQVIDMKGVIVESFNAQGKDLNLPINLTSYSNGIYTILISGENGSSVLKSVISH
ncbi:MAG: T9SS type A sorting domain-containing protein [Bacteroidetes bacterium]|nr:T9SS type A sorting domain-containing protein [Bacteroidota bacterium]